MVKNPPANEKTQVMQIQSLGQEDPREETATHSSILAWKIPRTENPTYRESWQAAVHEDTESVVTEQLSSMQQHSSQYLL